MFGTQQKIGLFFGIITGILCATLLNWWLNWTILALTAGLVTGLETGLWTGNPATTKKMHLQALRAMFEFFFKKSFWSECWTFTLSLIVALSFLAGLVLVFFSAMYLYNWQILPLGFDFTYNLLAGDYADKLSELKSLVGIIQILTTVALLLISLNFPILKTPVTTDTRTNLFIALMPVGGLVLGGLTYYFSVILAVLIVLALTTLVGIILYYVFSALLIGLLKSASHNESITITVGIIGGVMAGLGGGLWWTNLEFGPTLLACVLGCLNGYALAYATYRLSQSVWFQTKHLAKVKETA